MRLNLNLFSSNQNLEIQSITYGLNLFIPTFILIISSLFENYELTAELGILIGINIIFTQIFSSNARSLIISKKLDFPIKNFILFRIFISIFILILDILVLSYFNFSYKFFLFQISILIILQWLIELILTYFEINNKNKKINFYFKFQIFFLIIIVLNFIFYKDFYYIYFVFNIFIFLYFLKHLIKIKKNTSNKSKIKEILKISLTSTSFFSSFSISFANLLWRIFIISFCGKIYAGIYFAGFAIGSLPGTFFNNTFGPSMIKKNLNFDKNLKILLYFFIFIILCLLFYSVKTYQYLFIDNFDTQVFCTFLSIFGSFFMVKGLYFRQYFIQKTNYQSLIFKIDIFYSLLVALIVPSLFYIGGYKLIIISFLISSIISFLIYSLAYKFLLKK